MRVSLAKALFAAPSVLLLDEPTNHLDLEACVWLENHLAEYTKCLVVVSHSEDFLNTVCNNIIWMKPNPHMNQGFNMTGCQLAYYGGNYDSFCKVMGEQERVAALTKALKDFKGAVVTVSENEAFTSEISNEKWVVDNGNVVVHQIRDAKAR